MSSPSSPTSPEKRLHALKHSRTLNSLADSIRSLRDSTPFESKSGPASPVNSTPSTPRFGAQLFGLNKQSPTTPLEQQNAPAVTERVDGKFSPRPLLFSTMSSEDVSRSPKARFQTFMSSNSTEQSPQYAPISPLKSNNSSPQSPPYLNKRTISSPILHNATTPRDLGPPTPTRSPNQKQYALTGSTLISNMAPSVQIRPATTETQSPNPTSPLNNNETADIKTIIARAGSAEAAIEQLLKERQAAAIRNEQLWQLVEKQRAMILGLNRDLEMALQDKEKYWRKLKDQPASLKTSSENGQSPRVSSETQQSESQSFNGPSKLLPNGLPKLATSSAQSPRQLNLPLTPESAESSDKHTQMSPILSHSKAGNNLHSMHDQQASSPRMKRSESDLSLAPSTEATPPRSIIESTIASGEKSRKPPPKPLNLSSINVVVKEPVIDSDSEYSEIEESDHSSWDERGRRPTREDDDRQREVLILKEEQERRSRSAKSKAAKSKPIAVEKPSFAVEVPIISYRGVDLPARLNNVVGLPSSPRAPLLGGLQSPLHPSLSSIGSLLKGADRPVPQRFVTAPLMSPGLPATPRPGDRPMNAPQPRMPVKPVKSMVCLSPQEPGMGLPFSPLPSQHFPTSRPNVGLPSLPSPLVQAAAFSKPTTYPPSMATSVHPTNGTTSNMDHTSSLTLESVPSGLIYQGFMSEHYPNLLLPPNALPVIDVKVQSCRLMPTKLGRNVKDAEEDQPFTLGIYSRANGRQLWVVEKTLLALNMMDQSLKSSSTFSTRTPDRSLFNGQSPAKIEARRSALDSYLQVLLDTAMDDKTALTICGFFSTDVRPPMSSDSLRSPTNENGPPRRRKEGYLSKKGKSFGGWKARYFVITGAEVHYYDTLGGDLSGTINLRDAQIARQTSTGADDAEYRHAFMIMEVKRKDSSTMNRHILCAETDEERDDWIEVLLPYTDLAENEETTISIVESASIELSGQIRGLNDVKHAKVASLQRIPFLQSVSYDSTQAAEVPQFGGKSARASWSPAASTDRGSDSSSVAGRSNQMQIPPPQIAPAKASPTIAKKKRSMFGFRIRPSEENVPLPPPLLNSNNTAVSSPVRRETSARGVFGIPLAEAAEYHSPAGIDVTLPSPIYRCIEYLEQKQAAKEEGIFRLSGSNSVVKALKERFNSEGDVKLLDGQQYDVHAVASVLKLYLRELPESVLTRKLHLDFLRIIDAQEDHRQKVIGVNILVHKLPEANHETLATLSRFLIDIVNNSDTNKMNVRNVGIVFSPTLNIPAPLISLFLTDYGAIFGATDDLAPSPLIQDLTNGTTAPIAVHGNGMDSIRSPRKQLFTDLPTPSFAQNGFGSFMQTPLLFTNEQAQMLRDQAGPRAQDARATYDTTGFMPLKQAYDTPGLTATALRLSAISNASR